MSEPDDFAAQALEHVRCLSQDIGSRGSCTETQRQACDYAAREMQALGLQEVGVETFRAVPSTYRPFVLCFSFAFAGALLALIFGGRALMGLAGLLNLLGAWGMLAETDLSPNWARALLRKRQGHNVHGMIPPAGPVRQQIVLCAHLDTHRTPVFYSSKTWQDIFSALVSLAFVSMAAGALAFGLGALFGWSGLRWFALVIIPIQVFALSLCVHADFTPFNPGANDDASGVGSALAMGKRLVKQPLSQSAVHLVFTDCEEVGATGFAAYLDAHAAGLGPDAFYIILDEVGLGYIKYLTADGLVIKHKTHPRALQAARKAAAACPDLRVVEEVGLAYTDALVATKRGLAALTLCTIPGAEERGISHWHQMSDTLETLNPRTLSNIHDFVWRILQDADQASER